MSRTSNSYSATARVGAQQIVRFEGARTSAFQLCACVLIAASLILRVWHIGNIPGLNGDEAWYGANAESVLHGGAIPWRTPSGNVINPFFFGPLVILHLIFAPSIVVVRSISIVSSVAALCANWLLAKRVFGRSMALATTLLLAVLPEAIAQARIAWDPSQSLFADALVLYLALLSVSDRSRSLRWFSLAVMSFVVAVVVHPTNAFAGTFLIGAELLRHRTAIRSLFSRDTSRLRALTYLLAMSCGVAAIVAMQWRAFSRAARLLVDGRAMLAYAGSWGNLFSGSTAFRYVAGSVADPGRSPIADNFGLVITVLIFAFVVAGYVSRWFREVGANETDHLLYAGWFALVGAFWIVGGVDALTPGNERYALVLIVPTVVVVCRSAIILADSNRRARLLLVALGLAIPAWMLVEVKTRYFDFVFRTGGRSVQTFRTAAVEPKLQAWQLVTAEDQRGTAEATIATSTWWNYWPMLYFAFKAEKPPQVLRVLQPEGAVMDSVVVGAADRHLWFVEFARSQEIAAFRSSLDQRGITYRTTYIDDYAGNPVLEVLTVTNTTDRSTITPPFPTLSSGKAVDMDVLGEATTAYMSRR